MGVNQQHIPFPLRSSLPSCFGYSLQRFTLIMFNFVTPWLLSTILNVFDNLLSECSVALLEACTISPCDTTRYSPLNNRINFPNEFLHRSTTMTCCPLPSSSRVQFLFFIYSISFPQNDSTNSLQHLRLRAYYLLPHVLLQICQKFKTN